MADQKAKRGKIKKAKRNKRPRVLRQSPRGGHVRKCPHRAYTLGFTLGSVYSYFLRLQFKRGDAQEHIHTFVWVFLYGLMEKPEQGFWLIYIYLDINTSGVVEQGRVQYG